MPMALKSLSMIVEERDRQEYEEGYSCNHDDGHDEGQLALLAAAYCLSSRNDPITGSFATGTKEVAGELEAYGWEFKPKTAVSDLVRAGALIIAELERKLRKVNHRRR